MTSEPTGREAILAAFDRLFDKAANKLELTLTTEEKDAVKRNFSERFGSALQIAETMEFPHIPEQVMREMENRIDEVSSAEIAGYLAAVPLASQVQQIVNAIALQAAEQRMLEHYMNQADSQYGGN